MSLVRKEGWEESPQEAPIIQPVSAQRTALCLESLQEKYKVAVLGHLLMEIDTKCAPTQVSFKGFGALSPNYPLYRPGFRRYQIPGRESTSAGVSSVLCLLVPSCCRLYQCRTRSSPPAQRAAMMKQEDCCSTKPLLQVLPCARFWESRCSIRNQQASCFSLIHFPLLLQNTWG